MINTHWSSVPKQAYFECHSVACSVFGGEHLAKGPLSDLYTFLHMFREDTLLPGQRARLPTLSKHLLSIWQLFILGYNLRQMKNKLKIQNTNHVCMLISFLMWTWHEGCQPVCPCSSLLAVNMCRTRELQLCSCNCRRLESGVPKGVEKRSWLTSASSGLPGVLDTERRRLFGVRSTEETGEGQRILKSNDEKLLRQYW